jgi:hypothetical protein
MAKGGYIGVDDKARKIKKCYIGVDGVARKVKKAYIGVDGVARLIYTCGDTWRKYTANEWYQPAWYEQDNLMVGDSYTTTETIQTVPTLWSNYKFDTSEGFYATGDPDTGDFSVNSSSVYQRRIHASATGDDGNPIWTVEYTCVASATYYPPQSTYVKGDYVGEVYAEEGQYPTTGSIVHMEDGYIYTYENGSYYCYEKVTE